MWKLQNNCSCLTCKQNPSLDHTRKDLSEDRNKNCRRIRRILTRKGDRRPNHESAQGTRAPATTLYVLCDKLWVTWWTWDILCTWLTCWPNCTGNSSVRHNVPHSYSEWATGAGGYVPYLGSLTLIAEDGECTTEFCTRLNREQAIGASMQKIWKSHSIQISMKIWLMKALAWPLML